MSRYSYVDATATRNHIATLQGAGWSFRAIAASCDGLITDQGIGRIARGCVTRVRDCTEWAVLEVDPIGLPTGTTRGGIEPFVPKAGAIRRIQALLAIGWTHAHISAATGFQTGAFIHQSTAGLCRLSTHRRVAEAYRHLATRPGPSELTRRRAAERGYASPAAWDNIDRDEAPDRDEADRWSEDLVDEVMVERIAAGQPRPRRATRAENQAAYDVLAARGVSAYDMEHRYGLAPRRYSSTPVQGGVSA